MDFNNGENDSYERIPNVTLPNWNATPNNGSPNQNLNEITTVPVTNWNTTPNNGSPNQNLNEITTIPVTNWNSTPNNGSPHSPSRSCKEKCIENCNSAKCPKYATLSQVIYPENTLLCNKQCKESCTQGTCAKYINKTEEDTAISRQCMCKRVSTNNGCSKKTRDCTKSFPTQSMRSLVKSTDTNDLIDPPCLEKQPSFPCAQQPACVVTKSEYYKTPEPIPYLLCPHCCRKIHLLSTICSKNKPCESDCTANTPPMSLSSSHLNSCQAKLCIQPTPPIPCPSEAKGICSHCQPQYSVVQPQKPACSTQQLQRTTCPHFQLTNSSCPVKSVYLDVNGTEMCMRSTGNVSVGNRQPPTNTAAFDFLKTLNTCMGGGPCVHSTEENNHKQSSVPNCCGRLGPQQTSSCVRSRHNRSSEQRRSPQIKLKEKTSTMVLYMEPNFENQRSMSKTNMFYDCASTDTTKIPNNDLEAPETFVSALKKLTLMTGQLLENFEKAMKNKERSYKKQPNVKLKMTKQLSTIKIPVPTYDMREWNGSMKYVLPLSLKLVPSHKKKSQNDSDYFILSTDGNEPETSESRHY